MMLAVISSLVPQAVIIVTLFNMSGKIALWIDGYVGLVSYPINLLQIEVGHFYINLFGVLGPSPGLAAGVLFATVLVSIVFLIAIDAPVQMLRAAVRARLGRGKKRFAPPGALINEPNRLILDNPSSQ